MQGQADAHNVTQRIETHLKLHKLPIVWSDIRHTKSGNFRTGTQGKRDTYDPGVMPEDRSLPCPSYFKIRLNTWPVPLLTLTLLASAQGNQD